MSEKQKQKQPLTEAELAELKANGKITLSDPKVRSLRPAPEGKRYTMWDGGQPNLALRVTDKGRKTWNVVRRRPGDRQPVWHKLGDYPTLSLADAREQAGAALRLLAKGTTPREVQEEKRREEARRRKNTFASVAEDFIKDHLPELRRAGAAERLIRRELIPSLGDKPITEIKRADITGLVNTVKARKTPYAAHHVLASVRKMFNWALERDEYGLEVSPVATVKSKKLIGKPKPRQHVLSDSELFLFWRATKKIPYPFGPLFRLLLLTGQRRAEIADARWDEVENDVLTVPAARMKSKEDHSVPLTDAVLAILEKAPRFKDPKDDKVGVFVFTTTHGKRPVSGFSKAKRRLDQEIERTRHALMRLAKRQERELTVPKMKPFRLHDLRRTCRTGLSKLRTLPLVAELVVAHKQQGVAAVYDTHRYDAEKREALVQWERHLLSVVEPKPGGANVVTLPVRGAP